MWIVASLECRSTDTRNDIYHVIKQQTPLYYIEEIIWIGWKNEIGKAFSAFFPYIFTFRFEFYEISLISDPFPNYLLKTSIVWVVIQQNHAT